MKRNPFLNRVLFVRSLCWLQFVKAFAVSLHLKKDSISQWHSKAKAMEQTVAWMANRDIFAVGCAG